MAKIEVEGVTISEILDWPIEYFDELVLLDKPIVLNIGSAEVLGQFAVKGTTLIVELVQIDGGGEGILPAVSKISKHVAKLKRLEHIECVVHAIHCKYPNLKLRTHLEKTGFTIKKVPDKGKAYFKVFDLE